MGTGGDVSTAANRLCLPGSVISPGVGIGFASVVEPLSFPPTPSTIAAEDVEREIDRLHRAQELVREHLEEHVRGVHAPATEDWSQIFAAHVLVLDDRPFFESIEHRIRDHRLPADRAVEEAFAAAAARLAASEDCYMRSRAEDLRDVCASVRRALAYGGAAFERHTATGRPTVLVVSDLRPSVALRARHEDIAAVVTDSTVQVSHAAILLRAAGIPTLGRIRVDESEIRDGTPLLVDAAAGELIIHPTEGDVTAARKRLADQRPIHADATQPPLDVELPNGESVALFANLDHPVQGPLCLAYRLRGVGLFRTEFLVDGLGSLPDEEMQYRTIRELADALGGRPLVVRTFDFGADKEPVGFHGCLGPNPALGLRGIRRHLQRSPEELRTQLRAILRVSADADVSILLPMVTTVDDVRAVRGILREETERLLSRGVRVSGTVKLGAMLEVPSAALEAAELLEVADFLSVGTNDLVQYLTAADRDNPAVLDYQTPAKSGLYRLLEFVMAAARAAGRQHDLSVCGELASDPAGARELVRLGFRSLSVTPQAAATVRAALRAPTALRRLAETRKAVS
jgi:phosphotransferase system enzyme I (PtsI)